MRVLFITGEYPPMQGGVGDCTYEIARGLAARGVAVTVLTGDEEQRTKDERSSNDENPVRVLRRIKRWDWGARGVIREAIRETGAEIVHVQYQTGAFGQQPMINFAPRWIGRPSPPGPLSQGERGGKWVVTFHDLLPMYLFPKAGRARDWVTFELARRTDAVIATNEEDAARLEAVLKRGVARIPIGSNIAPTPISAEERELVRAKLGVAGDELLLCYFGFLNESKGGETLVRALAELLQVNLLNAKLLMLGGQTGGSDATNVAYLARVRGLVRELGLEQRVLWTDYMPQAKVSAHFYASDLCVLPYRDGASFRRGTFMAALAHGRAIVTTGDGEGERERGREGEVEGASFPELRDGENVMLVPPDDVDALAAMVRRVASDAALRARLEAGALATAQFFTWDRIVDAHIRLYAGLVQA